MFLDISTSTYEKYQVTEYTVIPSLVHIKPPQEIMEVGDETTSLGQVSAPEWKFQRLQGPPAPKKIGSWHGVTGIREISIKFHGRKRQ
jgi:hypothetical protein